MPGIEEAMAKGAKRQAHKALAKKRKKGLPSARAKVSPEKAGTILEHGEVKGHKLTKKQKGFFGAIRGRKG